MGSIFPPRAPDSSFAENLGTEIVTILVGSDKKQYTVHKNLLTSQSDYFDKALNGGFREAGENSIHLEEDDPAAIALLVGWLYRGVIPGAKSKSVYAENAFPKSNIPISLPIGGTKIRVPVHVESSTDTPFNGFGTSIIDHFAYQSISAHPRYSNFSNEELRLSDYIEGRKDESLETRIDLEEDSSADNIVQRTWTGITGQHNTSNILPRPTATVELLGHARTSTTSTDLIARPPVPSSTFTDSFGASRTGLNWSADRARDVGDQQPSDPSARRTDGSIPSGSGTAPTLTIHVSQQVVSNSSETPASHINDSPGPLPSAQRTSSERSLRGGPLFGVPAFTNAMNQNTPEIASSPFWQGLVEQTASASIQSDTVSSTQQQEISSDLEPLANRSQETSSTSSSKASTPDPVLGRPVARQVPQTMTDGPAQSSSSNSASEDNRDPLTRLHQGSACCFHGRTIQPQSSPTLFGGLASPASSFPPQTDPVTRTVHPETQNNFMRHTSLNTVQDPVWRAAQKSKPEMAPFYRTDEDHQTALLHLTIFAETTCWPTLFNAAITAYIDGERSLDRPPPLDHIIHIYERTHEESSIRTWAVDTLASSKGEVDMSGYMSLLVEYEAFLAGVLAKLREKGSREAEHSRLGFDGAGAFRYRMMEHGKGNVFGKGKEKARF